MNEHGLMYENLAVANAAKRTDVRNHVTKTNSHALAACTRRSRARTASSTRQLTECKHDSKTSSRCRISGTVQTDTRVRWLANDAIPGRKTTSYPRTSAKRRRSEKSAKQTERRRSCLPGAKNSRSPPNWPCRGYQLTGTGSTDRESRHQLAADSTLFPHSQPGQHKAHPPRDQFWSPELIDTQPFFFGTQKPW